MARRAYLSGGMEYAADEGRDWRSEMQSWLERELGCTVFNPNVESDRLLGTEYRGIDFRELKKQDIARYRRIVERLVTTATRSPCGRISLSSTGTIPHSAGRERRGS